MAYKIKAYARDENGNAKQLLIETAAQKVMCQISENPPMWIPLDEVINDHAEDINENTAKIAEHSEQLQLASNFNYAVCSTLGNVAAKIADIAPFVLGVGVEVTINFTYPNTTPAATLNISGTGAKPVYYRGAPLQGDKLIGVQTFSYDGTSWNIVGDIDTDTDTTYDIMSVNEVLLGSSVTARTINALNLKQTITQISGDIVNASLADGYDVSGLQASLSNLIFRLASQGVIDGDGLDTVVVMDSPDDIVLVSGMYANGKVYI